MKLTDFCLVLIAPWRGVVRRCTDGFDLVDGDVFLAHRDAVGLAPQPNHVVLMLSRVLAYQHPPIIKHEQVVGPCKVVDVALVLVRGCVWPADDGRVNSVHVPRCGHGHSVDDATVVLRQVDVILPIRHAIGNA